jgi:hypothetical protein
MVLRYRLSLLQMIRTFPKNMVNSNLTAGLTMHGFWVLAQPEVDAPTLANRRAFKSNKKDSKSKSGSRKKANLKKHGGSSGADDNGQTELYVNLSFMTRHSDVADLAQSVNMILVRMKVSMQISRPFSVGSQIPSLF